MAALAIYGFGVLFLQVRELTTWAEKTTRTGWAVGIKPWQFIVASCGLPVQVTRIVNRAKAVREFIANSVAPKMS